MSNQIDNICKCRDILTNRPEKLRGYIGVFNRTVDELHRQLLKKAKDYSRELDFTSQDLIEFSQDIDFVLDRWRDTLDPESNIKRLFETMDKKDRKIYFDEQMMPVFDTLMLQRDVGETLLRYSSLLKYLGVYLYFLENASKDEFALMYTNRYGF